MGYRYQIWRANVSLPFDMRIHSLPPVLVIILESSAINLSALVVLLVTYVANSPAQYIGMERLTFDSPDALSDKEWLFTSA
jgi:hypothetical protein